MGKKYSCTPRKESAKNGQNLYGMYHPYQRKPKQNKKILIKLLIFDLPKLGLDRLELAWTKASQRVFVHFLPKLGKSTIVCCERTLYNKHRMVTVTDVKELDKA